MKLKPAEHQPSGTSDAVLSPKLLVNYLYLDIDERRRFAQARLQVHTVLKHQIINEL